MRWSVRGVRGRSRAAPGVGARCGARGRGRPVSAGAPVACRKWGAGWRGGSWPQRERRPVAQARRSRRCRGESSAQQNGYPARRARGSRQCRRGSWPRRERRPARRRPGPHRYHRGSWRERHPAKRARREQRPVHPQQPPRASATAQSPMPGSWSGRARPTWVSPQGPALLGRRLPRGGRSVVPRSGVLAEAYACRARARDLIVDRRWGCGGWSRRLCGGRCGRIWSRAGFRVCAPRRRGPRRPSRRGG